MLVVFYRISLLIISFQNLSLHIADFILMKLLSYVSKMIFLFRFVLLLDLSAAFDSIDHNILLNRLQYWYSFSSTGLNLLFSFLFSRSQIFVNSVLKSQSNLLEYGVPQGSVLRPLLYSLYTTPLLSVKSNHPGIQYHFYADDTHIYFSFSPELTSLALSAIESCTYKRCVLMDDIK